jgi:hypothetical protein
MRFEGQVWFDFSTPTVWMFYRFVAALAAEGHDVALDWVPRPIEHERLAMSTYLAFPHADDRGRFLHAMLGLVHIEHADPGSSATVDRAVSAAGATVEPDRVTSVGPALDRIGEEAMALGVDRLPALYRHGPVSAVALNGAALLGDLERRARLILDVADDDGVWAVAKP